MLKLDEASIERELIAARKWRDQHLTAWEELVSEMTGPSFRRHDSMADENSDGENFALAYVSLVMPRVTHDVPKVRIAAEEPGAEEIIAEELELAMNLWGKRSGLRRELIRLATDMLAAWSVGLVTHGATSARTVDFGGGGFTPRLYRLPPSSFVMDPAATDINEARYQGHTYPEDHEDLLEKAKGEDADGWILEAIEELTPTSDATSSRFTADDKRDVPDREQVLVTELWFPELAHPDAKPGKHHGSIVTVGESPEGVVKIIRKERPFFGPPGGPYVLFGCYAVPGDAYPLGPLMAAAGLIRDLNLHMRFVAQSARKYKRVVFVDSQRVKNAQAIVDSPDLLVVPVAGPVDAETVQAVEIGGITAQQIEWAKMNRERLERLTGINETIRGNVTGQATATEVQTASASSSVRLEWIKRQFLEGCDTAYRRVAWYLATDNQVKIPLGVPGKKKYGGPRSYTGGRIDFNKLDLEIDGYSVERTDDAMLQRRAVELMQIGMQLAQAKAQLPGAADWQGMAGDIGEMLNQPSLADRLKDQRGAGQAPPAAGMAPAAPPSGPPRGPATQAGLAQQAVARR